MAILNRFFKSINLPSFYDGRLVLTILLWVVGAEGNILPFFNPLELRPNSFAFNLQGYIAEDPVSLREFFHDWGGDYHPRSGDNAALELMRGDIGISLKRGWYLGYFYRLDAVVRANRGFVDGFHDVKNNYRLKKEKRYDLDLGVNGVESHGITIAKRFDLYKDHLHQFSMSLSAYGSYCVNSQDGTLHGKGVFHSDDSYSAAAIADYYYTHNYLYSGREIEHEFKGYGYGMDFSLLYRDMENRNTFGLVINDLLAQVKWQHIPYSLVYVDTNNQRVKDGYIEYNPIIHGWELYKNHTQKLDSRYDLWLSHSFDSGYIIKLGWQKLDFLNYPYTSIAYIWGEKKVAVAYENRFHSISIDYKSSYFHCSILTNGLKNFSALGISLGFLIPF